MGTQPVKEIHHHYYNCSAPNGQLPNSASGYKQGERGPRAQFSNPTIYKKTEAEAFSGGAIKKQPQASFPDINSKNQKNLKIQSSDELNLEVQRLQNMIDEYKEGIKGAQEYGKKMQDFTKYEEFKNLSLETYIKKLQEMNLPEKDVGSDGICRKIVVGKVSAGKSSMLNNLLDLDLEAGVGETTEETQLVYHHEKVAIFDTPGENQDFNTEQIENIKLIAESNEVFILYPDSLKNAEHLIRVIASIKPKHTYLVRTHCDKANKKDKKTLDEEIQTDRQVLESWKIKGIPIYATSAKGKQLFDNNKVKNLLVRYPKNI